MRISDWSSDVCSSDLSRRDSPMNPSVQRSRGQILRSRGIGVRVGTLIGVAWLAFGVSVMASAARVPIAIVGVVIAAVLLQRSRRLIAASRSEEHTSELQSLIRSSYAVF